MQVKASGNPCQNCYSFMSVFYKARTLNQLNKQDDPALGLDSSRIGATLDSYESPNFDFKSQTVWFDKGESFWLRASPCGDTHCMGPVTATLNSATATVQVRPAFQYKGGHETHTLVHIRFDLSACATISYAQTLENQTIAAEREKYAGMLKTNPHSGHYAEDVWTVGPGDYIVDDGIPGCGVHQIDYIRDAADAIAAFGMTGHAGALKSLLETAAQEMAKQGVPKIPGDLSILLGKIFGVQRYANCVQLSVVIPADAVFGGNLFNAHDGRRRAFVPRGKIVSWGGRALKPLW